MSHRVISRSPDLKQLEDEGYELEIKSGHLLIKHVPYVTPSGKVDYGVLVSVLELANDVTVKPARHEVTFSGEIPSDKEGNPLTYIIASSGTQTLAEGIEIHHTFSRKPLDGYRDYHHKMTAYIAIVSDPAQQIDPEATAMTFPLVPDDDEGSVFNYADTASSRAGIALVTDKLKVNPIAIVGLGGTGSYILDLVAKTPVKEIHLFDGDTFSQHNAFRAPGAPTGEELENRPKKPEHLARQYAPMRSGIIDHNYYIDDSNVDELHGMSFVFLALDKGAAKKLIVAKLGEFGIPFVDVGMGVYDADGALGGQLRTTTVTPANHEAIGIKKLIDFSDGDENNEYSQNIQIADLNSLHAALAVIKWKKLLGFYADLGSEHESIYAINDNSLINESEDGAA